VIVAPRATACRRSCPRAVATLGTSSPRCASMSNRGSVSAIAGARGAPGPGEAAGDAAGSPLWAWLLSRSSKPSAAALWFTGEVAVEYAGAAGAPALLSAARAQPLSINPNTDPTAKPTDVRIALETRDDATALQSPAAARAQALLTPLGVITAVSGHRSW